MSPTIIILTGNCALYIIYMYVEVRHGIYMCSKIWKIENMHRPNSLALQAGKKTVSLQFFAWNCEKAAIQQWPFVIKIWVLLKRTSVKYWLYYCYVYIYIPNQQNTILYILLYYYIIVARILYYINITLLLNIIYI